MGYTTSLGLFADFVSHSFVSEKVTELKKHFRDLKGTTKDCFERQCISVQHITNLLRLLSADNFPDHKMFLESHLNDLNEANDQSELIGQLTFNMDYYSFQLLDFLVNELGLDVKDKMARYKSDMQKFRQETPVTLFCQTQQQRRMKLSPETQEVVAEFRVPTNPIEFKLEDIELFAQRYASHYNLRDFAMCLGGIRLGSSVVTCIWFVPQSITEKLKSNIPGFLLKKHGITMLRVSGDCVFRPHRKLVSRLLVCSKMHNIIFYSII